MKVLIAAVMLSAVASGVSAYTGTKWCVVDQDKSTIGKCYRDAATCTTRKRGNSVCIEMRN